VEGLSPDERVTVLLDEIRAGDSSAADRLAPLVYDEMRVLAGHLFGPADSSRTLQATALVHEAWIRLAGNLDRLNDRVHFFRVAARAMRQVLADYARAHRAQKRGGDRRNVTFESAGEPAAAGTFDLVALDDSLAKLARLNPRHAEVVECRLFGGLTIGETAGVLGVSHGTVESDWDMARAWLRQELGRV
jgi:RNA polymerase sigma factor (TIGR02999 family)